MLHNLHLSSEPTYTRSEPSASNSSAAHLYISLYSGLLMLDAIYNQGNASFAIQAELHWN